MGRADPTRKTPRHRSATPRLRRRWILEHYVQRLEAHRLEMMSLLPMRNARRTVGCEEVVATRTTIPY